MKRFDDLNYAQEEWMVDHNNTKMVYIPIKIVNNPVSEAKFFDIPLVIEANFPFSITLDIDKRLDVKCCNIGIEYLVLPTDSRITMLDVCNLKFRPVKKSLNFYD
jgi:hypothetical protein